MDCRVYPHQVRLTKTPITLPEAYWVFPPSLPRLSSFVYLRPIACFIWAQGILRGRVASCDRASTEPEHSQPSLMAPPTPNLSTMANSVPIISPTPPTPDSASPQTAGLGLDGLGDMLSPDQDAFDPSSLSPYKENFRYGSSPLTPRSPTSPLYQPMSTEGAAVGSSSQDEMSPFNFHPVSLAKSPVVKSVSDLVIGGMVSRHFTDVAIERWAKTRPQVQAQQRLAPDLSRASAAGSDISPQLSTSPNGPRVLAQHEQRAKYSILVEHLPRSGSGAHALERFWLACTHLAFTSDTFRLLRGHAVCGGRRAGQL